MSKLTLTCRAWTPIGKNSLVGKADLHIGELRLMVRGEAVLAYCPTAFDGRGA